MNNLSLIRSKNLKYSSKQLSLSVFKNSKNHILNNCNIKEKGGSR